MATLRTLSIRAADSEPVHSNRKCDAKDELLTWRPLGVRSRKCLSEGSPCTEGNRAIAVPTCHQSPTLQVVHVQRGSLKISNPASSARHPQLSPLSSWYTPLRTSG